jgi:hypothetical protein
LAVTRRRKEVTVLVTVRVPAKVSFADVREEVRDGLNNGSEAWGYGFTVVSVKPIPRDGVIQPRKPRVRRTYPLLDAMGVK